MKWLEVGRQKQAERLLKHPHQYIDDLVRLAVFAVFDLERPGEVRRSGKLIAVGTQQHVDYVYPSFALAQQLGQSPVAVAEALARHITTWLENLSAQQRPLLGVEAVAGYVNFELAADYLGTAARQTARWLQKPRAQVERAQTARLVVAGATMGNTLEATVALRAYTFMSETYTMAGYEVEGWYIAADWSEEAAEFAAAQFAAHRGAFQGEEKAPLLRTFRRAKPHEPELALTERTMRELMISDLKGLREYAAERAFLIRLRREFLEAQADLLGHGRRAMIEPESRLASRVHHWLDGVGVANSRHLGVVTDPQTEAAYYQATDGPLVSLRTAQGMLFRAAYLLYVTDRLLTEARRRRGDPLIVLVPAAMHHALMDHAERVLPGRAKQLVVCADPQHFPADVVQAQPTPSVPKTFAGIAETLHRALDRGLYADKAWRSKLLHLMDIPAELESLVAQLHPLELARFFAQDRVVAAALLEGVEQPEVS